MSGDLTAAADLGQRSCTELRQTGWKWALATALCGDAQIRLLHGDSSGATDELREGLALFRALGDPLGEAHAVRTIACLAAHLGWAREAARLLAAAAAKRDLHGAGLAPSERQREADAIVRARRELGQTSVHRGEKGWTDAALDKRCRGGSGDPLFTAPRGSHNVVAYRQTIIPASNRRRWRHPVIAGAHPLRRPAPGHVAAAGAVPGRPRCHPRSPIPG